MRGELDWIVMKALEKDRNRRYETANGFAADVQRYLADEPVEACPPSAWYRLAQVRPAEPDGADDGGPRRPVPWSRARRSSTWQAIRADGGATRPERSTAHAALRDGKARHARGGRGLKTALSADGAAHIAGSAWPSTPGTTDDLAA